MKFSKSSAKIWAIYFFAVLMSIFIHEIGHCLVAWIYGFRAIPTPAKEYPIDNIPIELQKYVALGGIAGTLFVFVIGTTLYLRSPNKLNSALFAASISSPAMYNILFLLKGRGHDATEFQDAQLAIGAAYSGHLLDWIFMVLSIVAIAIWIGLKRPSLNAIPKIAVAAIITFIFIAALQKINNSVFDPLFEPKSIHGRGNSNLMRHSTAQEPNFVSFVLLMTTQTFRNENLFR